MPSTTEVKRRPGLLAAAASLRGNRPFALLWVSNLFFFAGAWSQTLVLGWMAFQITGSEMKVAIFTAARLAPLLIGPFAGAFADRHNRVRLLILAAGWAMIAVAGVAALASVATVPYWALVIGGFAIGLAQSPSQPARASLVLELVGRRNLSNANALNALAMNMTQVFGPAIGGAMISTVGAAAALWISTGWYAISLVLLLPLRGLGAAVHRSTESTLAMVTGGIRAITRNRLASAVLLVTLAANTLLWPIYQAFMPVFADEQLGLDAAGLGALLTCGGVGGLVGALIIAGMGDFRAKGGVFVIGTACWAAMWAIFALSHHPAVSFVAMAGIGLASAAFGVLQTTLLLMTTEPALHGRALGLQELAIGIMPLSSLLLGVIAERLGVGWTTFGCALLLIAFLTTLAFRVPNLLPYSGIEDGNAPSETTQEPPDGEIDAAPGMPA
ncbi:MFS transporter [Microlunatus soli]|uniref:Predicted arabinose efflux permease, MFS family n=1 Tax=Microlunatus soli TaxID=630515 RepID=A0A1H1TQR7_9ACTN|nr:MFS transporter [Microlunatus soli]SDS62411.1 Predicted arabinose efflux permease, MFS family [Microlunatus soli]